MDADALLLELKRRIEDLERVARSIGDGSLRFFQETYQPTPRLQPAELGFLRTISLLYVYFFETGREGVEFLADKLDKFGLDAGGVQRKFLVIVKCLRTYSHHNLYLDSGHDREVIKNCESWFRDTCGTAVPVTEEHWRSCLIQILSDATRLLDFFGTVIRSIEADESTQEILREWRFRRDRYMSPQEFDSLVASASVDMGLQVDSVKFRIRFYDRWRRDLTLLPGTCDPEVEARKLVERSLLTDLDAVLPVTGKDIIEMLNVSPGPKVGELLRIARGLYLRDRCSKDALLKALRAHVAT